MAESLSLILIFNIENGCLGNLGDKKRSLIMLIELVIQIEKETKLNHRCDRKRNRYKPPQDQKRKYHKDILNWFN